MLELTHLLIAYLFLLGTTIGSFLNVVVLRYEQSTPLSGRSRCPSCNKVLAWYELIPLVSWLIQRGRCRGCNAPISAQYPLVELATGFVFVGVVLVHGGVFGVPAPFVFLPSLLPIVPGSASLLYLALGLTLWSLLIVVTVYDLRTKLVPDRFSYTFALLALAYSLLPVVVAWFTAAPIVPVIVPVLLMHIAAGPLLFLPFFLLWYISDGRWLGLGDGKLVLGIGWLLGMLGGFSAILFAFWIGALVATGLLAYQHVLARFQARARGEGGASAGPTGEQLTLKSEIPFAPFLVLGTAIVYFGGVTILALF